MASPDLAVSVESMVDFFCPRVPGEATRRHHEVGPCAGINHSSVTLSAKGRTDVPVITGEDEQLFRHQYAQEMPLLSGQRSTEWVKRLPAVVAALNGEVTRLTGKRPSDAIKAKTVEQKPSSVVPDRPVGLKEQKLPSGVSVCYLYQPGKLEGGRHCVTDPVWSLEVCWLGGSVTKPDDHVLYYLQDSPPRGFVREELLVVPPDTQLPPDGVLKR